MKIDMYELFGYVLFASIIGWLGWVASGNCGGAVLSVILFTGIIDVHKKVSALSISDGEAIVRVQAAGTLLVTEATRTAASMGAEMSEGTDKPCTSILDKPTTMEKMVSDA